MHKLKSVLASQQIGFGLFIGLKDPAIIEIAGYADYDFVVIDLEHSTLDLQTMEHMIRAGKIGNVSSVIRVPQEDYATILRVVEFGADAIMVPHVTTKEQMEKIINMAKYPPIGHRGIDDSTRAAKYGNVSLIEHMNEQNEHVLVIAMIEDALALENLDEIVSVKGLDLVFIGMADLVVSLGLLGQQDKTVISKIVNTIIEKASKAGVRVGMSASDPIAAEEVTSMGVQFVTTPDVDILHLSQTLTEHLKKVKDHMVHSNNSTVV